MPDTPATSLQDTLDRRKFLAFLAAGVVAATLPLPVGFPTEEVLPLSLQGDWVFKYFVTVVKNGPSEWKFMGKVPESEWRLA